MQETDLPVNMLLVQARELNGPWVVYGLSELSLTLSSISVISSNNA